MGRDGGGWRGTRLKPRNAWYILYFLLLIIKFVYYQWDQGMGARISTILVYNF